VRRIAVALVALLACTLGLGCRETPPAALAPTRLTVFAASSLTESFKAIGAAFERAHPGVRVEFNFASSSALATQIAEAAPADVFASADNANMEKVASRSLIAGQAVAFARNTPVIVVPADNRAKIEAARNLARPGVKVVLAAADVPIGSYARQVLDRLAADPAYGASFRDAALRNVVSNEANVRAVLTKVELGEADAGIVYRTDAAVSGSKVRTVALPESANVIAVYPIAVLQAARQPEAARAFVAFVHSAEGQQALRSAGFDPAP
jgi:molybdate transport system substrate-binding protein